MVQTQILLSLSRQCISHIFGMREIGLDDFERYRDGPGEIQTVLVEAHGHCRGPAAVSSSWSDTMLVVPPACPAPRAVTCSGTAEGMEMNGPTAAVPGHAQGALLSFLVWL